MALSKTTVTFNIVLLYRVMYRVMLTIIPLNQVALLFPFLGYHTSSSYHHVDAFVIFLQLIGTGIHETIKCATLLITVQVSKAAHIKTHVVLSRLSDCQGRVSGSHVCAVDVRECCAKVCTRAQ